MQEGRVSRGTIPEAFPTERFFAKRKERCCPTGQCQNVVTDCDAESRIASFRRPIKEGVIG